MVIGVVVVAWIDISLTQLRFPAAESLASSECIHELVFRAKSGRWIQLGDKESCSQLYLSVVRNDVGSSIYSCHLLV
jgi:hypothetical protein